jgi:3-hydroxyacyl-CoA dehydrogenase
MGHGLGLCYALGGHHVTLVDRDDAALDRARTGVAEAATFLVEHGLVDDGSADPAIARIDYADHLPDAIGAAGLVQEAIHENLAAKQALFAEIEAAASDDAILATNTSSLRIGTVTARMRQPGRVIGIHWVAPPYLVPLVEVVRTEATPDALVDRALDVLTALGKVPVVVPDVPGFALNRLQYALLAAAVDLVDQKIVGPREVDLLIRHAMAPRMLAFGLLELFDLIVDGRTVEAVATYLFEETGDLRFRPSPRLADLVERGRRGMITGAGWFEYDGEPEEIASRRDDAFARAYRAQAELDRTVGPTLARSPGT